MKKTLSLLAIAASTFAFAYKSDKNQYAQADMQQDQDLFKQNERAFFAAAEFLWWTVEQDATDFALRSTATNSMDQNLFPQGRYQTAEFDWNPGYRLTLGYFNAPNYWDIYAQYTWLYSSGTDSANDPAASNRFLNATQASFLPGPLDRATSKIGFHYHLADLLVDRAFFPNPHLRLKVLGGLTGSWISENWRVRYVGETEIERLRHKWSFKGIGLRIGMNMDWFLGADFYLTGRWTTGALIGRYRNWYTQVEFTDLENFRSTSYKDYRPAITSQFLLGPSYQKSFNCARLEIFAGYEWNAWLNLQENIRPLSMTTGSSVVNHNRSMILLHGLTTKISVDF